MSHQENYGGGKSDWVKLEFDATYVLDVVGEVLGKVEGGIDEGDVVLARTLVPEANKHFNGLTSSEL